MNRNTIVAISMAAVLGTTGGVALAVQQSRSDDRTPPAASPSPSGTPAPSDTANPTPTSPSPTATPSVSGDDDSTNEPLLWATSNVLHDGDRTVRLDLAGQVQKVVRMDDGWVLAESATPATTTYDLWWIPRGDGQQARFATVEGDWDADPTGQHVVGQSAADGDQVTVWTPDTGAERRWDRTQTGATFAGFMGQRVLISMDNQADGFGWQKFIWDPKTGETSDPGGPAQGDQVTPGYPNMKVSPGGSYASGTSNAEGMPTLDANCLHLESTVLKKQRVGWNTCDWRLNDSENTFSPDGTRLLVVPSETDGFGPRTFGVVDASDGPRQPVAVVDTAEWTLDAEWADNDHLYVVRATDGDASKGYVIDRCDFDSLCTPVARMKEAPAVGTTR